MNQTHTAEMFDLLIYMFDERQHNTFGLKLSNLEWPVSVLFGKLHQSI